jgi:predicted ester cyclase
MTENLVSHWLGDRSLHGAGGLEGGNGQFLRRLSLLAGDKGVWRGTWHATQRKEWEGIPASGRTAKWTVIIIGRFEGEKLAEDWVEYDRYNLFRQLGAL